MQQVIDAINTPDFVYDKQLAASSSLGKAKQPRLTERPIASIPLNAVVALATPAQITLNVLNEKMLVIGKTENERILLKLDVSYEGKPNGRYEVYVNLPENTPVTSDQAKNTSQGLSHFLLMIPKAKVGDGFFVMTSLTNWRHQNKT